MHPVVIVFLLFAAFGVLYFLSQSQSGAVANVMAAIRAKVGLSDHQLFVIIGTILAIACVFYIVNFIRSEATRSASKKRLNDDVKDKMHSKYR